MPETRGLSLFIAGVPTNYNVTPVSPFLVDATLVPGSGPVLWRSSRSFYLSAPGTPGSSPFSCHHLALELPEGRGPMWVQGHSVGVGSV